MSSGMRMLGLPDVVGYKEIKAGWIWGLVTEDAGRVRNQTCYQICTWRNPGMGIGALLGDTYRLYVNLPSCKHVIFLPEEEVHAKAMELLAERNKKVEERNARVFPRRNKS